MLGEGKLNLVTIRCSQLSVAFFDRFNSIHDFGDSDAFFFREISTANAGKLDGFVDAGLDGFREGNINGNIDRSDNRDIVLGGLGDLFAVFAVTSITTISSMSVTMSMMSRLADSDHLDVFFLFERHFNSLGGGTNSLLSVRVGADFVGDFFDGFSAHSAGDSVALFFVYDLLDGQFNIFADSFKGRHTSFSNFCHIDNSAVVFGFFVTIAMMSIGRGMMTISGGRLVIGRGRLVVSRFRFVNGFRFVWCRSERLCCSIMSLYIYDHRS